MKDDPLHRPLTFKIISPKGDKITYEFSERQLMSMNKSDFFILNRIPEILKDVWENLRSEDGDNA